MIPIYNNYNNNDNYNHISTNSILLNYITIVKILNINDNFENNNIG